MCIRDREAASLSSLASLWRAEWLSLWSGNHDLIAVEGGGEIQVRAQRKMHRWMRRSTHAPAHPAPIDTRIDTTSRMPTTHMLAACACVDSLVS
eukprot:778330-Rhodomonas_salina.1